MAGHVGANLARKFVTQFTPDILSRAAQTGVQHGFDRRRLAPSLEKFLMTGVMPESVAEYQLGRQAGRLGRVVGKATSTSDPALHEARMNRIKKILASPQAESHPLTRPFLESVLPAVSVTTPEEWERRFSGTSLGQTGVTIAKDVGSRLGEAPTAAPETKAFKIPRFLTTHEKAKPSVAGRAAGVGAMAAGVAAEPGYLGHIGINKLRHLIAEPPTQKEMSRPGIRGLFSRYPHRWLSSMGQKSMNAAVERGLTGKPMNPLLRGMYDVSLTPFVGELEDVGRAANVRATEPRSYKRMLADPSSRIGAIGQRLKALPSRAAMGARQLMGKTKQLAGRARQAVPWPRAPKV